jgi:hypothetical protein
VKLTARHLFRGKGQHRRQPFPQPAFGACVTQAFRHCRPCGADVPVVLHPSGAHTCQHGHTTEGEPR